MIGNPFRKYMVGPLQGNLGQYQAANPANQQQIAQQAAGLNTALQGAAQRVAMGQAAAAYGNYTTPPPKFEENVPEDELRYEGIALRPGSLLLAQYSQFPTRPLGFSIDMCQRMLMV